MRDKADVMAALSFLNSPAETERLARLIVRDLRENDEISALPRPVFDRIAEIVSVFYGLGYLDGASRQQ